MNLELAADVSLKMDNLLKYGDSIIRSHLGAIFLNARDQAVPVAAVPPHGVAIPVGGASFEGVAFTALKLLNAPVTIFAPAGACSFLRCVQLERCHNAGAQIQIVDGCHVEAARKAAAAARMIFLDPSKWLDVGTPPPP
jgi:hypothetical protein